jgi:2-phospho-L-lactate guanylyltransferase
VTIVALIPCKGFAEGKSRLADLLDPATRRALCETFFERTVEVARSVMPPMHVLVVTPDAEVIACADRLGVPASFDAGHGLNFALDAARHRLTPGLSADASLLILPTDLPLATTAALNQAIEERSDVVIVPDEELIGTNVLLLRPAARHSFQFRFGPDSYRQHREQARLNGLSCRILAGSPLAFDVDRADQYQRMRARLSPDQNTL